MILCDGPRTSYKVMLCIKTHACEGENLEMFHHNIIACPYIDIDGLYLCKQTTVTLHVLSFELVLLLVNE